jgi:hypothetical protein
MGVRLNYLEGKVNRLDEKVTALAQ